jgi:hypothetical protein
VRLKLFAVALKQQQHSHVAVHVTIAASAAASQPHAHTPRTAVHPSHTAPTLTPSRPVHQRIATPAQSTQDTS